MKERSEMTPEELSVNDAQSTSLSINGIKEASVLANLIALAAGAMTSQRIYDLAMEQIEFNVEIGLFTEDDMRAMLQKVYAIPLLFGIATVVVDTAKKCTHCKCDDNVCCYCGEQKNVSKMRSRHVH